jgi:hypothetical protein
MTAEQKARFLYTDMWAITVDEYTAKQCALKAVDEILNQCKKINVSHKIGAYETVKDFMDSVTDIQNQLDYHVLANYSYWQQVRQQIQQL